MKNSQFLFISSMIFVAPNVSGWTGIAIGAVALVAALVSKARENE